MLMRFTVVVIMAVICQFNNINKVFAYGYWASQENEFTNIKDYVLGFGRSALYLANISASTIDNGKTKTLECRGAYCTQYSTIDNFDVVIGIGSFSLYSTTLNSISNQVNAIGNFAFHNSNLFNNAIGFDNTNSQVKSLHPDSFIFVLFCFFFVLRLAFYCLMPLGYFFFCFCLVSLVFCFHLW